MKKKLSPLKVVIVIIASIAVAALVVVIAKLLGFQGGGDNDMLPWWNMLHSLF